ncbi:MAG: FAD-dependent oxidoreductase [Proteobacteria bacterium]|nr:FAD-dependent oxidoreductase [Pseudomonadota bacterium]
MSGPDPAARQKGVRQSYSYPKYPFRRPAAVDSGTVEHQRVVIVGAGSVGLAAAVEFACLGIETVVLDDDDTVSAGSRAICWSKRTLEVLDRSGVAEPMVDKGVIWRQGRVYRGEREIYNFDLLPEAGHKMPAFINLQQYHTEEYLVDRAVTLGKTDLRWRNAVVDIDLDLDDGDPDDGGDLQGGGGALLTVDTPDGRYQIRADYVLAADGVRSTLRRAMGLEFQGRTFEERFLITDIRMNADFPMERRFWFEPSFHAGQSALLHRQPDNIYRIDLQLGPDADPVEESKPERVIPRVCKMVGEDLDFDLEWISVYTFTCRRMERFRHGPVFFVGDAAHVVSPFGARGGNGGIQDIDNLVWKLALVLGGEAPAALLDSYDAERLPAADENILNSARSTDFMTPKNQVSADFRRAVLSLAERAPFARTLVNSGRLSLPHVYAATALSTGDDDAFAGDGPVPGASALDAPVLLNGAQSWLLNHLGQRFVALCFVDPEALGDDWIKAWSKALASLTPSVDLVVVGRSDIASRSSIAILDDISGQAFARWAAKPGSVYLLRPDQHVAARWLEAPTVSVLAAALARAIARKEAG